MYRYASPDVEEQVRRQLVGAFPVGVPLVVVAHAADAFREATRARTDVSVLGLADLASIASIEAAGVFLDALTDFVDRAAALARLRAIAPRSRLFAVVANPCYLESLERFLFGAPPPAPPYVEADVPTFFAANGWRLVSHAPLLAHAAPACPTRLAGRRLSVIARTTDEERRLTTPAWFVSADPA